MIILYLYLGWVVWVSVGFFIGFYAFKNNEELTGASLLVIVFVSWPVFLVKEVFKK